MAEHCLNHVKPKTELTGGAPRRHIAARMVGPLVALMLYIVLTVTAESSARACIGCFRLPFDTIADKVQRWQRVVVARRVQENNGWWQVDRVILDIQDAGGTLQRVDPRPMDAHAPVGTRYLVRWDKLTNTWRAEMAASQELIDFLVGSVAANSVVEEPLSVRQQIQRLRFFVPYVEHSDTRIAESARAELIKSPYAVLHGLVAEFDRDQLVTWIEDNAADGHRAALYITLLGLCRDQRDVAWVRQRIQQNRTDGDKRQLATLLTAHIELRGEPAVRWIEKEYIHDSRRSLDEIIAAVDALRTHGEAQTRVSRERILASLHRVLHRRPALAELVIDDFERWQDWTIAPRLMELLSSGKQPWNNAQILQYLDSCPLPDAKRVAREWPP